MDKSRIALPAARPWTTRPRVLAIDPGTSLMGVAALDERGLCYYGVKELRHHRPAAQLARATRTVLGDLIAHHHPTLIAYETSTHMQATAPPLLQTQEREIRRTAKAAGLPFAAYAPSAIRQIICGDAWATKPVVAARLIERFPELVRYRTNQTPLGERYWLNMFDALAVAVVALNDDEAGRGAVGESPARAA